MTMEMERASLDRMGFATLPALPQRDRNRSIWNRFMARLFGGPAAHPRVARRYHGFRAVTVRENEKSRRRKVAERNQAHRRMAAASRRRNRG